MLGGEIWMESNLPKIEDGSDQEALGSTFYFTIPYHTEVIDETNSFNEVMPQLDDSLVGKLQILIAEDDEISVELISIALQKYGQEIIYVKTGKEAVEACLNNPDIDLVIMDIQMPEMNGYEATRQIREFNKGVKIIAQTAYALHGDKEKAIAAGCDDYIAKPIDADALIQKIFNLLNVSK